MSICKTNCKLYKKIKDLVVIEDNYMCSKDCYYIHPYFEFGDDGDVTSCKLFNECVLNMERCEDCVEVFGDNPLGCI